MKIEKIEDKLEGIEVINGIWLDRGGFFGATIEIAGEIAELRFEAADFIWNQGGLDKVSFVFELDRAVVCVSKSDFKGWDKLLAKLRAASLPKVYTEFADSFV